jgi:hypothetical protein
VNVATCVPLSERGFGVYKGQGQFGVFVFSEPDGRSYGGSRPGPVNFSAKASLIFLPRRDKWMRTPLNSPDQKSPALLYPYGECSSGSGPGAVFLIGIDHNFDTAGDSQLVEDAVQIILDRVFGEFQFPSDLNVGETFGKAKNYLFFAL